MPSGPLCTTLHATHNHRNNADLLCALVFCNISTHSQKTLLRSWPLDLSTLLARSSLVLSSQICLFRVSRCSPQSQFSDRGCIAYSRHPIPFPASTESSHNCRRQPPPEQRPSLNSKRKSLLLTSCELTCLVGLASYLFRASMRHAPPPVAAVLWSPGSTMESKLGQLGPVCRCSFQQPA